MASDPVAADGPRTRPSDRPAVLDTDISDRIIEVLGRVVGAPPRSWTLSIGVGVVCAILSLLLRFAATPYIGDGEALLTAFPLVLVASLTTGRCGGWTCLVICTIGSWYLFIGERFDFSFGPFEKGILIGTFVAGAFVIQICVLMRRMFREIVALRSTERLLSRELEHRIKNTLTLVLSISRQTFRAERPIERALEDFEGRMMALAAAQDLAGHWGHGPASLAEVAARSLSAFCGQAPDDRLVLSGPDVIVDVDVTVGLCLVFHELATNSAKYGALSNACGLVEIRWAADENGQLRVTWTDRDGPLVEAPASEGFGTKLLQRIVTRNLKGSIAASYPPAGFRAELVLPI